MSEALQDIVREELERLNLELFELRVGGSRNRPVVDVRIEREDGEKITVDDCARASRAIESRLDAGSFADSRYVLEVSSPGIERPLRNVADWRRFAGRDAVVTSDDVDGAPPAGSREVRIVGLEGEPGDEIAVVEDRGGRTLRIPLSAVRKARLAFNWKR
ncbi:MAG TPA: hypothetical protein VIF83_10995 [Gemmatimonadaceae bacterium]|jgi:ribosome maturation factor RimP